MIVVDTSAIVDVLLESPAPDDLRERIAGGGELHAPHVIDVEFLGVLRRLVARQELTLDAASVARSDFDDLAITRYPHVFLRARMWELRDNLTPSDAAFVALGEVLGLPVVTCDGRMASAPGHHATIESFVR